MEEGREGEWRAAEERGESELARRGRGGERGDGERESREEREGGSSISNTVKEVRAVEVSCVGLNNCCGIGRVCGCAGVS